MMQEYITHAAIFQDNVLTLGKCHYDCMKKHPSWKVNRIFNESMGFFTSCKRFVSRKDAEIIACNAGQIDPKDRTIQTLISEEFWFYGGYEYDEVKGYFKPESEKI